MSPTLWNHSLDSWSHDKFGSHLEDKSIGGRETAHDPKDTTSCVKQGGSGVMAWACTAALGPGSLVFIDYVTAGSVWGYTFSSHSARRCKWIGQLCTAQIDNDPKHTARATQDFLKAKKLKILKGPNQSSDLNPKEHAFQMLKTKLMSEKLRDKQQLKVAVANVWQSISRDEMENLATSMDSRLQVVIDCKGFSSKY